MIIMDEMNIIWGNKINITSDFVKIFDEFLKYQKLVLGG